MLNFHLRNYRALKRHLETLFIHGRRVTDKIKCPYHVHKLFSYFFKKVRCLQAKSDFISKIF